MENPPTSVGAVLIQPFSQCVNGVVITARCLVRSRFVQRHKQGSAHSGRNKPAKAQGERAANEEGLMFHAEFGGVYLLGTKSGFIYAVS